MPRTVEVTCPPDETEKLLERIQPLDGLVGLRLQRGVSLQPQGDLITVELINRALPELMRILGEHGIGRETGSTISTSRPSSLTSASSERQISHDSNDANWEEVEMIIAEESNMNINTLILMAASGFFAAVGLSADTLHLVIASMVVAPGFEPLVRISLGLVAGGSKWKQGLVATLQGYGMLVAGAAFASLSLRLLGGLPPGSRGTYMPDGILIDFWTTVTASSILVTMVAGVAGAVLLGTLRTTVLTAGVLVALTVIPTAALVGMGLVSGELSLAWKGLFRWALDVSLVVLMASLVFIWKRATVQGRKIFP